MPVTIVEDAAASYSESESESESGGSASEFESRTSTSWKQQAIRRISHKASSNVTPHSNSVNNNNASSKAKSNPKALPPLTPTESRLSFAHNRNSNNNNINTYSNSNSDHTNSINNDNNFSNSSRLLTPRGSVHNIHHNTYLRQLTRSKKQNWCMLYCGGSQPVKKALETTSMRYGIHLKSESFDW